MIAYQRHSDGKWLRVEIEQMKGEEQLAVSFTCDLNQASLCHYPEDIGRLSTALQKQVLQVKVDRVTTVMRANNYDN